MKKKLLFLLLVICSVTSRAQLTVTNTQTPAQLVQNVLLGGGVTVSNIKFNGSTVNANVTRDQAGYFANGSTTNIGIDNGVILATGKTSIAIGPNNSGGSTLATSNPVAGDPDLAILASPNTINNAAILEFDFIPTGEDLTFNFVFASEEYPEWANSSFNDAFGFFLSGPGISGPFSGGAANIAIIPTTVNTPVTINNLNNGTTNSGPCEFCTYYVNNGTGTTPTVNSTIQYDGFTTVLTASATVQCGQLYHIKLAIANVGDNSLDSAVFLQANSFNTTPLELPEDYLIANGFAPCFGSSVEICTGLDPSVPHTWTFNGVPIAGATSTCLTITEPGEYCVTAYPFGANCPITDCIVIEFQPEIPAQNPSDLVECELIYDLTQTIPEIMNGMNPNNFDISFYNTLADAQNAFMPITNTTAYPGFHGEQIFVRIEDFTGCWVTVTFFLYQNCGTAVTPPDLVSCDDATPDGFTSFNLAQQTSIILGTASPSDYTVSYYTSQSDAQSGTSPVGPNFTNTSNPQTIYASMVSNTDPNDASIVTFQLIVNALPTVTISGSTSICPANSAVITFTGTPNAVVTYTVNSGPNQNITLDGSGTATVTTPILTANEVYTLVGVSNPATLCSQNQTGSATITVEPLPTATISGDSTICQNGPCQTITFTGAGGTAPYTFTYTLNGGANQTITSTGNVATICAPTSVTGSFVYTLVSVQSAGATGCSQAQSGSATVTVGPLPTATVSGTATVCQGAAGVPVTFTGADSAGPFTFSYTINGGASQQVTTTTGNSVDIIIPTTTVGTFQVELTGVSANGCSQTLSGSVIVTVTPLPTATVSGAASVCQNGASPVVTFTGANATAPYTITYTYNGGSPQTIVTDASGVATLNAPTDVVGVFPYTLVSVQDANGCSQAQTGSVSISVIALPTATIAGTSTVCQNGPCQNITFTGASGTAPYTFTYTINGGAPLSVTTTSGNSVTVCAPSDTVGTFTYTLTGVQSSGTPACSQSQSGSAVITVSPLPTATLTGSVAVCQGDAEPVLTFTGAGGTAPYNFSYQLNGVLQPVVSSGASSSVTISVPTTSAGSFTYTLVSVQEGSSCSQAQSATATVTVNTPPVISTPSAYNVCDDNNDGFSCTFDLHTKDNEITGGQPGLIVNYYETLTDSQTGANPITTATYCNIVSGIQTIYVSVSATGGASCASFTTLQLIVNPVPVPNPVIPDYALCDVNSPGDSTEGFMLSSMNAVILNGQSGVVVSYHLTQPDAQTGLNPISQAVAYNNVSSPQQIWVRLQNSASGCSAISSFNLVVNPLPVVVAPAPMNACSNGPTGFAEFILTQNDAAISGGAAGVVVSYHLTLAQAQNEQNALASPYTNTTPFSQVVYVRVENTATGCYDTTSLTLNVTQGPTALTPTPLQVCDPNSDGFASFDLTLANNEISGGSVPAGVTITYHETMTDAQNGTNAVSSPYSNIVAYTQTIYVSVAFDSTGCTNFVELQLIVNNTPMATEIPPLQVCDDNADCIGSFNLTTATSSILGSLDPAQYTVTYYVLESSAQSGQNPITNLTAFANTDPCNQTIWVRVEHNVTGCFDVVPLGLLVNPLPLVPFPVPSYSLCDVTNTGDEVEEFDLTSQLSAILMGQSGMEVSFYFSQADALAQSNPLVSPYTNVANAQTIFVLVRNAITGCSAITTMDLRVEPLPSLLAPGPVVECDADGDGFATFDLQALTAEMVQGAPGVLVSYHETPTDAELNNNAITNLTAYQNITPFVQFLYVRAQDATTGCFSVTMIELQVVAGPVVPVLPDLTLCDPGPNTQDGFAVFNLTQQTPLVLSAQSAGATNYTVTYHLDQASADAGTGPIIQAANYTNISNPQTIYVRIIQADGDCTATGSFNLVVNPPLALTTPAPLSLCDDGPTTAIPQTVFDLTVKNDEITQGLSGYTVTYYPSYQQALAGTGAITNATAYTNLTNPQTLGVEVTSPDGCRSFTTLDIRVLPLPTPRTDPPALEACDDNLPTGTEIFDLTQNELYIANNDPAVVFEYYANQQDALAGVNPIATPAAYEGSGTVWIKVLNSQVSFSGANCFVLVEQQLIVNPLPQVAPTPVDYTICDANNSGTAVFDLTQGNSTLTSGVLLAGQDPAGFTITYYLTQADAQTGTSPLAGSYTNTSNPQDVYVRVVDNATGCVNATAIVTLRVAAGAQVTAPAVSPLVSCDTDSDNDGVFVFDLTQMNTEILGGQDPAVFLVSYYSDAQASVLITNPAAYAASTGTIYAVVTNSATGCDSQIISIPVTVEQLLEPQITSSTQGNTICVAWDTTPPLLLSGITLYSSITGGQYTYQWSLNGQEITGATSPSYTVDTVAPGTYSLVVTSTTALGCSSQAATFEVIQSGPPVLSEPAYTVSNAFSDNQTITVNVNGFGDYEYSLDGGAWQQSNVFVGVGPGPHTVQVRDSNNTSCGDVGIPVINVINYPPYFTPNGDGIHDTWNIIGLEDQPSAKIYIFDRYGKLLKQLSPSDQSQGWNGTYNGQPLPSTDYWFTVYYNEAGANKEFKAHFSLKR